MWRRYMYQQWSQMNSQSSSIVELTSWMQSTKRLFSARTIPLRLGFERRFHLSPKQATTTRIVYHTARSHLTKTKQRSRSRCKSMGRPNGAKLLLIKSHLAFRLQPGWRGANLRPRLKMESRSTWQRHWCRAVQPGVYKYHCSWDNAARWQKKLTVDRCPFSLRGTMAHGQWKASVEIKATLVWVKHTVRPRGRTYCTCPDQHNDNQSKTGNLSLQRRPKAMWIEPVCLTLRRLG